MGADICLQHAVQEWLFAGAVVVEELAVFVGQHSAAPQLAVKGVLVEHLAARHAVDLEAQGREPVGSTPEVFATFIAAEIPKWAELVRISGATVD